MKLEVFNVEHGACAILNCDDGQRLVFDCGHNANSGWKPGDHLRRIGVNYVRALFVTNYDEDHVSGIENLFDNVTVGAIFRNMSVEPQTIEHLKSEDGMGNGIRFLVNKLKTFNHPVGVDDLGLPANVKVRLYRTEYPKFVDENNLSMLVELNINRMTFMFTGDMEKAGWQELLKRQDVRDALARTHVYFASHHGRESGCCDDVFNYCKPLFVVISDKAKGYQTQETHAYYHQRARGGVVIGCDGNRFVLTTRRDGDITFEIDANGYTVTTSQRSAQRSP